MLQCKLIYENIFSKIFTFHTNQEFEDDFITDLKKQPGIEAILNTTRYSVTIRIGEMFSQSDLEKALKEVYAGYGEQIKIG